MPLEWNPLACPPRSQVLASLSRVPATNAVTPVALGPGRPTAHGASEVSAAGPRRPPADNHRAAAATACAGAWEACSPSFGTSK